MIDLNTLVILASARKHSDTQKLVELVFKDTEYTLLDLLDYNIAPYNYEEKYHADDEFLRVVEQMLSHQLIVFATPVYWYAMSGTMKIFFDRLSDIVGSQKHLGRQMKGRYTTLITISSDKDLPEGFEVPFKRTSEYLDMNYINGFFNPRKSLINSPQEVRKEALLWLDKIKPYI
ncbi:MAG: NAD(P)H-dependent oxidoreductase [Bacteroidetes bacterium]|nr:MAG: NAD(P)H-dependent oxidoreductase [Bacteroidota bacterium]